MSPESIAKVREALAGLAERWNETPVWHAKNGQPAFDGGRICTTTRQCRLAAEAIAILDGANGWRPIAEFDTSKVGYISESMLLAGNGWSCEGYYNADYEGWWAANCHPTDYHDARLEPTHFQPLPEPPK